jgi:hypothetical protein
VDGLKESYATMVSRLLSFGFYVFDLAEVPPVEALFDDPAFRRLAQSVCPPAKQHLDPFQFNFILQLPGQTVAAHLDGVKARTPLKKKKNAHAISPASCTGSFSLSPFVSAPRFLFFFHSLYLSSSLSLSLSLSSMPCGRWLLNGTCLAGILLGRVALRPPAVAPRRHAVRRPCSLPRPLRGPGVQGRSFF